MIYLDNAATTISKPQAVIDAVAQAMCSLGNAGRGATSGALDAARTIHACRAKLSRLLGCPRADHVCFTPNSTVALNTAINGVVHPGDRVVTTVLEHNSVLRPLNRLAVERGVTVEHAGCDANGVLDYDELARLVTPGTRAVVVTHASNVTGNAVDIARVAAMAHEAGAIVIVDASQSAGTAHIDMRAMGLDVVCFTGHKGLMGPQGTGGLAVAEGIDVAPWAMGGTGVHSFDELQPLEWPTRLEAGTLNGHGIAGLSAGLDFIEARGGIEAIAAHERALAGRFLAGVREIPGITLYGAFDQPTRSAIVSLNVGDIDSAEISDALMQGWGIATRPGAHCAPLMHRALGTERQGVVRFSFGYFNTDEDVDTAIDALRDLAC
ncbi:aminotransferase class V-fold PLP-dependent enzyme [Collinsella sp. BIOML-A4]|uniref:aminotransferase class V-fold PLP-dependent enzyme n=1 Tax=unclassified Collinsella TaxID=2637548 RepID=UPI00136EACB1|nr:MULTISPECIES: aminotransferase class V-fold PLP-dependent enzyme [unclassified Collinsella]MZJ33828.1 aminotransferase class V-fold PLP-dependent enzyme [Collinsella sp. BIOML-A1]MZJ27991.1 aminotransferase class V-fold PLP-dependent enzyme [Collinsella sp. BIOML-A2]MZJ30014.1 aminotransferase class V-fold PLP-dependent enzyme [Collinsella sp. BIOML-A3]MZJ97571.1 aminotransferase class V-fold PLP-dependent enzyme [Collinsella sp. BIOML-A6]MZK31425.1 aminotransferase class V-fold PLP-depende